MDENDKQRAGRLKAKPDDGARARNKMAEEVEKNAPPDVLSVRDLVNESVERAGQRAETIDFCTTGHYKLDDWTDGFRPGFVWVFGADTSWGKSSWAVSVADENIKRGKRVLIVSAEDPPSLYADRLVVRRAKVSADLYRKKKIQDAESWDRINAVKMSAEDVPVYVSAGNKPIEKLDKHLAAIIRNEGIDMVIFDYLQEFVTEERHQDQRVRFKEASKRMRDLIRSHDKTGIILSQLTISNDTKIPDKHCIRESRDVSNAAEVIGIGFTPKDSVNAKDGSVRFEAGKKYILLDKNKAGPAKKFAEMRWNDLSACFDAVPDPVTERYNQMERDIGVDDSDFDRMS